MDDQTIVVAVYKQRCQMSVSDVGIKLTYDLDVNILQRETVACWRKHFWRVCERKQRAQFALCLKYVDEG